MHFLRLHLQLRLLKLLLLLLAPVSQAITLTLIVTIFGFFACTSQCDFVARMLRRTCTTLRNKLKRRQAIFEEFPILRIDLIIAMLQLLYFIVQGIFFLQVLVLKLLECLEFLIVDILVIAQIRFACFGKILGFLAIPIFLLFDFKEILDIRQFIDILLARCLQIDIHHVLLATLLIRFRLAQQFLHVHCLAFIILPVMILFTTWILRIHILIMLLIDFVFKTGIRFLSFKPSDFEYLTNRHMRSRQRLSIQRLLMEELRLLGIQQSVWGNRIPVLLKTNLIPGTDRTHIRFLVEKRLFLILCRQQYLVQFTQLLVDLLYHFLFHATNFILEFRDRRTEFLSCLGEHVRWNATDSWLRLKRRRGQRRCWWTCIVAKEILMATSRIIP